ncbi:MAG: hypothetical protein V4850_08445 [Myxococcota bacterium]
MPRLAALAILPVVACGIPDRDFVLVDDDVVCDGGDASFEEDWAASLDQVHGCNWQLRALDGRGILRLTLDAPEFVAALHGEAAAATYTLPDDQFHIAFEIGCGLDEGLCGEPEDFSPSVSRTYDATAGAADVSVDADGLAIVGLTGVTLTSEFGDSTTLDATFSTTLVE